MVLGLILGSKNFLVGIGIQHQKCIYGVQTDIEIKQFGIGIKPKVAVGIGIGAERILLFAFNLNPFTCIICVTGITIVFPWD